VNDVREANKRNAENALRRERLLLDAVTRTTDVMLVLLDEQFNFVWVNQAYADTCRMTPDEMIGENHFALYPNEENEAIFRRVRDTGETVFYHEKPFNFPDQPERGVTFWDWSLSPVKDANAGVAGLVFSLRETTKFHRAKEALRESEKRLRMALDAAYVISFEWDIQRNLVRRFMSSEPALLATEDATLGTFEDVSDVVHPEDRESFVSNVQAAMERHDGTYESEFRVVRPDGSLAWLHERGRVERDADGRPARLIGLSQDISERKRIEQQLRESLAEKKLLLREIHHRVKNNLQVISGLLSLKARAIGDPGLGAVLTEVRDRVRSMGLVHETLVESGGLAILNFADYADRLTSSIWTAHGDAATGVKLRLEVEPVKLSATAAVPCGLILNELVSNALKYAFPSGYGEVTIGLTRQPATGRVCLRVRDDGVGMPPDLDWRHSPSLGLRLVHLLAEQLGGTVEIGSGRGTEFRVSLAIDEEDASASQSSSTPVGGVP